MERDTQLYLVLCAIICTGIGFGTGVFLTDTTQTTETSDDVVKDRITELAGDCGDAGYRSGTLVYDRTGLLNPLNNGTHTLFCLNETTGRAAPVTTWNNSVGTGGGDEA